MAINIQPEQYDSLLSVTSHYPGDYDVNVTLHDSRIFWVPDDTHDPVRLSIATPFPAPAVASLGNLSALPTDIFLMICLQLDVTSLFRLRQVNRYARAIISDMHEYHDIATCAIQTLHALLVTRIGTRFNLGQFYTAFRSVECQVCGFFGDLLFLPNLRRCCCNCLWFEWEHLRVASLADVEDFYRSSAAGISEEELARILPVVHVDPKRHFMRSINYTNWTEPQKLVSVADAIRALRKLGDKQQPGLQAYVFERTLCEDRMRMAAAEFPYKNRTGGIEYGAVCKGCELVYYTWEGFAWDTGRDLRSLDRIYTEEQFLEHFQSCLGAQELWRVTREGTVPIPLEFLMLHFPGALDCLWPQWLRMRILESRGLVKGRD